MPAICTVSGVLDRHDDAGSEHELLPGLGKVDHVQSVRAALPDVRDLKSSQTTSARHNRAHEVKHARRDTARGKRVRSSTEESRPARMQAAAEALCTLTGSFCQSCVPAEYSLHTRPQQRSSCRPRILNASIATQSLPAANLVGSVPRCIAQQCGQQPRRNHTSAMLRSGVCSRSHANAPSCCQGSWCPNGRGRQASWTSRRRSAAGAPGGSGGTQQTCLRSAPKRWVKRACACKLFFLPHSLPARGRTRKR